MKSPDIFLVLIEDEYQRPVLKGVYKSKLNAQKRASRVSTFMNKAQILKTKLKN